MHKRIQLRSNVSSTPTDEGLWNVVRLAIELPCNLWWSMTCTAFFGWMSKHNYASNSRYMFEIAYYYYCDGFDCVRRMNAHFCVFYCSDSIYQVSIHVVKHYLNMIEYYLLFETQSAQFRSKKVLLELLIIATYYCCCISKGAHLLTHWTSVFSYIKYADILMQYTKILLLYSRLLQKVAFQTPKVAMQVTFGTRYRSPKPVPQWRRSFPCSPKPVPQWRRSFPRYLTHIY